MRVMKRNWIRAAAIGLAMLGLSACGLDRSDSAENRIHVETPFSIAKAGNRATLDFEATAKELKAGKAYMVSLTFERREGADPLEAVIGKPPRTPLLFRVKVVKLTEAGQEEPLPLVSGATYVGQIDPTTHPNLMREDPAAGIYYAFTYASTGSQGFARLVGFDVKQAGRYRAQVETVQAQPVFANVPSVLIVQKHFNVGK